MNDIYKTLKQKARSFLASNDLLGESVRIKARALTAEEAIGNPEANDFPIQKGKERLMQADFRTSRFSTAYGRTPVCPISCKST